jgi:hypothetical protein
MDLKLTTAFAGGAIAGALGVVPLLLIGQALCSVFPTAFRVAVWLVASLAIVATNLVTGTCPLPQTHRQIAQHVIAGRRPAGAWTFGGALGSGVVTYLPSCAPHVLALALVLLAPSLLATIAAAAGFGLGRALGIVGRFLAPDRASFEHVFQKGVAVMRKGAGCTLVTVLLAWWTFS